MKEIIELIKSDWFIIPVGGTIGLIALIGLLSDDRVIKITLGWWYFFTNKNNTLARERLKICVGCDKMSKGVCTSCGCVLQAKARIEEEECPLNKWSLK